MSMSIEHLDEGRKLDLYPLFLLHGQGQPGTAKNGRGFLFLTQTRGNRAQAPSSQCRTCLVPDRPVALRAGSPLLPPRLFDAWGLCRRNMGDDSRAVGSLAPPLRPLPTSPRNAIRLSNRFSGRPPNPRDRYYRRPRRLPRLSKRRSCLCLRASRLENLSSVKPSEKQKSSAGGRAGTILSSRGMFWRSRRV
jgi:hypothetical protein